ncbi:MAG: dodecin domain-containing protein [Methyloceanibacter sp.]|uniref:dodecin domain-containing protein n=1 Tax=Methyloceanibacter sp. TaxID=1965321 RepID=UPI003D9B075A
MGRGGADGGFARQCQRAQCRSIYMKNMEATVENGKIKSYRINAKISFTLED